MKMEVMNKSKLYAILYIADPVEQRYTPMIQKFSESLYYLYFWKTEEKAKEFLNKNNIPLKNCKIVSANDKIIDETLGYKRDYNLELKLLE